MAKEYINYRLYPEVSTCQALDRQISELRRIVPLVQQGKMGGNKIEAMRFKNKKELQFATMDCADKLRDLQINEGQDLISGRFEEAEKRIIGQSNQRRLFLLITGSAVLLIGLSVLLYVRYGKK